MTADQPLATRAVAVLVAVAAASLVLVAVVSDVAVAGVAVVIAIGLLVPVRVPWGGNVSMSAAAVIAAAALLDHADAAGAVGVAIVVGAAVLGGRQPAQATVSTLARAVAGGAAAIGGAVAIDALVDGTVPMLALALGAAAGVIAGDLVAVQLSPDVDQRPDLRSALPVYLTLGCAGVLIAVAVDRVGVAMAAVAAFPLLITRFSFDRHAGATDTLDQTVQALGLVPELAGQAPLGHSERSALYATALARELGFDRARAMRAVTATRLHHIGAVPFDGDRTEALTPTVVAAHGARILRDAKLPVEIADLLESAAADALDAEAPTLDAAVVRIAATFDDLVGDDTAAADRGLALVSGAARDPHSRRVAAALLELVATDAGLVRDAIAAGDRFREAAVGLDLESLTAARGGAGELLPFTRRG